jgi:hypothetical protein
MSCPSCQCTWTVALAAGGGETLPSFVAALRWRRTQGEPAAPITRNTGDCPCQCTNCATIDADRRLAA